MASDIWSLACEIAEMWPEKYILRLPSNDKHSNLEQWLICLVSFQKQPKDLECFTLQSVKAKFQQYFSYIPEK